MDRIVSYLNPFSRLGKKKYSYRFPFVATIFVCVSLEYYGFVIARNPESVGIFAIIILAAVIIYFSFRDGFLGGFISTCLTISYYFYIIFSRKYTGELLTESIRTVLYFGVLYFGLVGVIGWLKQNIDSLVEKEIEARRVAEEGHAWLHTIMQQLPVGILLVSENGSKVEGNRQLEKVLGREVNGGLKLDSTSAYRNGKILTAKEWPIVRALTNGEVVKAEEIEYLRSDEKRLYLRVNAAPIRTKSQNGNAAVSTVYDITAEKEMEKRKDDFVNMASHELKTPITSMKLYLDLLVNQIKGSNNSKVKKIVGSLKYQTSRLQKLVSDFLDVSRLQSGKLVLRKEEFSLNNLIEEIVNELREITRQIKIGFSSAKDYKVFADRFRIYQAVTNLLTNAIKYSPDGSKVKIAIRGRLGKIEVSVKDFGIGIEKNEQKKIFNRLYQVNTDTEKTFPGIGLGLYISKEIVKKHAGRMWVVSQKGKGSTFYFNLPVKKNRNE